MNCLWCMEELTSQYSWSNFLTLMKPSGICDACSKNLELLKGNRCAVCSRMTDQGLCQDCSGWQQQDGGDPLKLNYSIFTYNSFMQEVVAKWKYRWDYVLGELFKPYVQAGFQQKFLKEKKELIAVPIPLSEERLQDRGFNQAEMLADFLPIKKQHLFTRIHGEKQAKKTRMQRVSTENPFSLRQSLQHPVLLVDDIYTTGTTLRHAARLLADNGCPEVYALTLIRG